MSLRLETQLNEAGAAQTEGRPVYGRADSLSGRPGRDFTLEGDAELRRAGTVVRGNRITWYPEDEEVLAVGAVRVVRQGSVFTGPELRLKLDSTEGFFTSPSYELPLYNGRGHAERVDFLGPDRIGLRNATYTTCRPEDPDWVLSAEDLVIDTEEESGKGRWAGLSLGGRKVLSVPWFAFPLGDRRRSGFLTPGFAMTSRTGPEFVLPYYWNIAPNRDLTLHPRVMVRRGLQLGAQYRYLDHTYQGDLKVEYTPDDSIAGRSRHLYSFQHSFADLGGWGGWVNMRGVSDDNYFVDYSRSILSSSERVLPRDVLATRRMGDWTLLARATRYQSILDARLAPPYERVPQFNATWAKRGVGGFDVDAVFDATWFQRPLQGSPEGLRMVAFPQVSYPIVRPGWFVVPKLGLHLSSYRLDGGSPLADTSLHRSVPVFSLDAGLVFERPASFFGRDLTQTLEPRLFYARAPYRDQSAFPVFDTGVADFGFPQLFSENSFVGHDRIADSNQLTTAVVSRLIEPATGAESLRFAIGQRMYFSDQRVSIPGVAARNDKRSDLLFAATAGLGRGMSIDAGLQYSVRDSEVPRLNLLWRYLPGDGRILNAGVRYLRDELGQIDTSWRWPLAPRWTMMGRVNYSWLKERVDPASGQLVDAKPGIIEGVLGLEYIVDCWTLRLVTQRFVTAEGRNTSAFFLQFELAGLARLGSDPFDILRRNIPGYRLPNDRPALPSRFFGYE
ncbi:MAG: LPS-assembly protein LptD [Gammaproteobacteria bacterium]